ncbi:hypothetical protein Droror1_Dr00023612 [Drosera rotundifolia]
MGWFRVCLLSSSSRPLQLTGILKKRVAFLSLILAGWPRAIEEKIAELQLLDSSSSKELGAAIVDERERERELQKQPLKSLLPKDDADGRNCILEAMCSQLKVLNISSNNFTGENDGAFDGCLNLRYLDISEKKFHRAIWAGVSLLNMFCASENRLSGLYGYGEWLFS